MHLACLRSRKEARVTAAKGQSGEGWKTRLRGQMEWYPPWKVRRVQSKELMTWFCFARTRAWYRILWDLERRPLLVMGGAWRFR